MCFHSLLLIRKLSFILKISLLEEKKSGTKRHNILQTFSSEWLAIYGITYSLKCSLACERFYGLQNGLLLCWIKMLQVLNIIRIFSKRKV